MQEKLPVKFRIKEAQKKITRSIANRKKSEDSYKPRPRNPRVGQGDI